MGIGVDNDLSKIIDCTSNLWCAFSGGLRKQVWNPQNCKYSSRIVKIAYLDFALSKNIVFNAEKLVGFLNWMLELRTKTRGHPLYIFFIDDWDYNGPLK